MKAFKDISIFKGIKQYFDEHGQEWKIEISNGKLDFFKLIAKTWMYSGTLYRKSTRSLKKLHEEFIS